MKIAHHYDRMGQRVMRERLINKTSHLLSIILINIQGRAQK